MKDFVVLRIDQAVLPPDLGLFKEQLPGFAWRGGDSDAQGPYFSGSDGAGVRVKYWFGEQPCDLTLSFDPAVDAEQRSALLDQVAATLAPRLGRVIVVTGLESG